MQKYITSDPSEKVISFYRKQLLKYGPVLECRNGKAVNAVPTPISCDSGDDAKNIELKVGTERKQHMVDVTPIAQGTEFGLVYFEETERGRQ